MEYDLEEIMEMAACDSVINCAHCGHGPLEPDFNTCPECGKTNILQSEGMV